LSSTDNELTDLNTEFNTDRPGTVLNMGAESIGGTTYRSKKLGVSGNKAAQKPPMEQKGREEMKI